MEKKTLISRIFKLIVLIASFSLLISGVMDYRALPKIYEDEALDIIAAPSKNMFLWGQEMMEGEPGVKHELKWTLMSGKAAEQELVVENKAELEVEVSFGEVRLVILDKGDNYIALDKKIKDSLKTISLKAGEYKISFVGKHFTGKIRIEKRM